LPLLRQPAVGVGGIARGCLGLRQVPSGLRLPRRGGGQGVPCPGGGGLAVLLCQPRAPGRCARVRLRLAQRWQRRRRGGGLGRGGRGCGRRAGDPGLRRGQCRRGGGPDGGGAGAGQVQQPGLGRANPP